MIRHHRGGLLFVLTALCCALVDDAAATQNITAECQHHNGRLVEKLNVFFSHYDTRLRRDDQHHRCQKFAAVRSYLQKMTASKCSTPFDSFSGLRHWRTLDNEMNCTCGGHSTACASIESCFHSEMHGFWTSRCDEVHAYNLQQPTKNRCHHTEENIHCKLVLVRSSCGNMTSPLANSILRLRSDMTSPECARNARRYWSFPTDNMFEYTANCTKTFVGQFDQCVATHLTRNDVVRFHDKNELIVTEKHQSLQSSCTALRSFRRCIVPLETSCKHGVGMVLSHQIDLHKYLLKMDFICKNRTLPVYTSSLKCYQDVVAGGQLGQCNSLWFDLRSALDNVTSHQFYCQRGHRGRHHVLRHVETLTLCHGLQFERQCGRNSSRVLTDLMTRALKDHVYLRFRYRPLCTHVYAATRRTTRRPTATTATPSGTPSTTQTSTTMTTTRMTTTTATSTASTFITTASTVASTVVPLSSTVELSTVFVEVERTSTSMEMTSGASVASESSTVVDENETTKQLSSTGSGPSEVHLLTGSGTRQIGVMPMFVPALVISISYRLHSVC